MHPHWLEHSIESSLRKLGLNKLDCIYLADPYEKGMELYGDPQEVELRIGQAFAFLEELYQDGKIGAYGVQTGHLTLNPIMMSVRNKVPLKKWPQF